MQVSIWHGYETPQPLQKDPTTTCKSLAKFCRRGCFSAEVSMKTALWKRRLMTAFAIKELNNGESNTNLHKEAIRSRPKIRTKPAKKTNPSEERCQFGMRNFYFFLLFPQLPEGFFSLSFLFFFSPCFSPPYCFSPTFLFFFSPNADVSLIFSVSFVAQALPQLNILLLHLCLPLLS